MNWRDATCEKCVFRVGDECRRFPPTFDAQSDMLELLTTVSYPTVAWDKEEYMEACAEYAETMPEKTSFALPFKPFPEDVKKKLEDDWNRAIDNAFSTPPNIGRKG